MRRKLNLYPDTVLSGEEGPAVAHSGTGGGSYGIQKKHDFVTGAVRDKKVFEEYNANSASVVDVELLGRHFDDASETSKHAEQEARRHAAKLSWIDLPDLQTAETLRLVPLGQITAASRFGPQTNAADMEVPDDISAMRTASRPRGSGGDDIEGNDRGTYSTRGALLAAIRTSELERLLHQMQGGAVKLPMAAAAFAVSCGAASALGKVEIAATNACRGGSVFDSYRASLKELNEKIEHSLELLRYFYACFPLNVKGTHDRAAKLHEALNHTLEGVTHMVELCRDNSELATPMQQWMQPLLYLLQCAIDKYAAEATLGRM